MADSALQTLAEYINKDFPSSNQQQGGTIPVINATSGGSGLVGTFDYNSNFTPDPSQYLNVSLKDDGGLNINVPRWASSDQEVMDQINNLAQIKVKFNADGTATHPLFNDLEGLNQKLYKKKQVLDIASSQFGGNIDAANTFVKNLGAYEDNFQEVRIPGIGDIKYSDFRDQVSKLSDQDKSKIVTSLQQGANSSDQNIRASSISGLNLLLNDSSKPLGAGLLTQLSEAGSALGETLLDKSIFGRLAGLQAQVVPLLSGGKIRYDQNAKQQALNLPDVDRARNIGDIIGNVGGTALDVFATQGIASGAVSGAKNIPGLASAIQSSRYVAPVAEEIVQNAAFAAGRKALLGQDYTNQDLAFDLVGVSLASGGVKLAKALEGRIANKAIDDIAQNANMNTLRETVQFAGEDLANTIKNSNIDEIVNTGKIGENGKNIVASTTSLENLSKFEAGNSLAKLNDITPTDDSFIRNALDNNNEELASEVFRKYNIDYNNEYRPLMDALAKTDESALIAGYKNSEAVDKFVSSIKAAYAPRAGIKLGESIASGSTDTVKTLSGNIGTTKRTGARLARNIGSDKARIYDTLIQEAKDIGAGKSLVGTGLAETSNSRVIDTIDRSIKLNMVKKLEQDGSIVRRMSTAKSAKLPRGEHIEVQVKKLSDGTKYKVAYANDEWLKANGYVRSTDSKISSFLDNLGQQKNASYIKEDVAKLIEARYGSQEGSNNILGTLADFSKELQNLVLSGGAPGTVINAFSGIETFNLLAASPEKSGDILKAYIIANSNAATNAKLVEKIPLLKKIANNGGDISFIKLPDVRPNELNFIQSTGDGGIETGTIASSALDATGIEKSKAKQIIDSAKSSFDKIAGEKTFQNLMPQYQIIALESAYNRGLRLGLNDSEAAKAAADTVRKFYAPKNLSKTWNDILSTVFLAPRYRGTQISRWANDILSPLRVLNGLKDGQTGFKKALAENSIQISHAISNLATLAGITAYTQATFGHNPWDKEIQSISNSPFALVIPKGDGEYSVIDPIGQSSSVIRSGFKLGDSILRGDTQETGDNVIGFGSILGQPILRSIFNKKYGGRPIVPEDSPIRDRLLGSLGFIAEQYSGHPYVKALNLYVNDGNTQDAVFQALELNIRSKDANKIAKNDFNFNVIPDTKKISEEYAGKISKIAYDNSMTDADKEDVIKNLQIEMFEKIKNRYNEFKQKYSALAPQDLTDFKKQALGKAVLSTRQVPTYFGSGTNLANEQIDVRNAQQVQLRQYARDAGFDIGTLLTDLKDRSSKYYGASNELDYQYKQVFKKNDKTGAISFYDVKKQYKDLIDVAYKTKDYKEVERLQNDYLSQFDARIKPLIDKYGIESLYQNRGIQRELSDYLTGFVPYSALKSAGQRGKPGQLNTPDTLQFLQERYGVGGRDKSNLPSDQSIQEGIQRINTSLSNGKIGSAQALARSLLSSVNRGIMGASEEDYNTLSSVINIKES